MLLIKLQADRQNRQERLRHNSLKYSFQMCIFIVDYFVLEMNHNFQTDKCFIILVLSSAKENGTEKFFRISKINSTMIP